MYINLFVFFVVVSFDFYLNENDKINYVYSRTNNNKKNVFAKNFSTITTVKIFLTIISAKNFFKSITKTFFNDVLLLNKTISTKNFIKSNICIKIKL